MYTDEVIYVSEESIKYLSKENNFIFNKKEGKVFL